MQKYIKSWEELENAILKLGLLPYFRNKIPGFSVEEMVPENILWDILNGPWEWKGLILRNLNCAYGKFFSNRAGYISLECLPDFINYRRVKSKLEPGSEEERIYKILIKNDSLLSKELKSLCGYLSPRHPRKSSNPFENMTLLETVSCKKEVRTESRFETIMTRLQMAGYVVIADFEYLYDKKGDRYGWGIARYTTPEALYGLKPSTSTPIQSYNRLFSKLRESMPDVNPRILDKLI